MTTRQIAKLTIASAALVVAASAADAGPNLVVNGSFELSDSGFSQTLTPEGWTTIGPANGVINYSVWHTPAYAGKYYYDEGGYGNSEDGPGDGIKQTVTTVPGQTYDLIFGLTSENDGPPEIADVTIGSQLTQYTLSDDGLSGPLAKPFVTHEISYTATSASTTIAFTTDAKSLDFGNNDPMIDGISFATPGSTGGGGGIPEPAVWTVILVGFAGIGTVLRTRAGTRPPTRRRGIFFG